MKKLYCAIFAYLIANTTILTGSAIAQLSVSTIGATDAVICYENANNPLSKDTRPCDKALQNPATTRADRLKTYVNRGILYNRVRNIKAAFEDFNAALKINPKSAEAWLNRGNSYFFANQLELALMNYQQAIDLNVGTPWAAWYNIGLVYDAQKKLAKAQEAYV